MGVKIKDVAKEANVSVATVSRVLNKIPLVNDETKKRVLDAIKKTGYKPNAIARSLKMQKTNTFGIMIPDITSPFYTQVVRGVEDVCNMYDYHIILCNTDSNPKKEETYLNVFIEKQCDGILYIGKGLTENLSNKIIECDVPVVLGALKDKENLLPSVMIDNEKAAYDITKHLIDLGHRKISFINDEDEHSFFASEREKGIIRALKENNIQISEQWQKKGKYTIKGGYLLAEEIFSSDNIPTAIIAANDEMAIGAIRKIEDMGLKVPEDISIVGFNDFWISEWVKPSITTVAQPMYDIGAICARMLIKMSNKEELGEKNIIVSHELIIRESIAKN